MSVLEIDPPPTREYSVRTHTAGLLKLRAVRSGHRCTISLEGDLDRSTVAALRRELDSAVPAAEVVVDLSGLTFMDSGALRPLLHVQESLSQSGGKLSLIAGSRRIQSVFRLTDTERRFTFGFDVSTEG